MDFEDVKKGLGFLIHLIDMLRNHDFSGILKNGQIFSTLCR